MLFHFPCPFKASSIRLRCLIFSDLPTGISRRRDRNRAPCPEAEPVTRSCMLYFPMPALIYFCSVGVPPKLPISLQGYEPG